ncbi:M23 family metallopeptidase [uncultured Friedmanniella sp.]|uniref:M23 family metallopeptidase n=1 Tax=uncultured Friedmanniella sp. TaxID=335381 RepID=UPI0035CA66FC
MPAQPKPRSAAAAERRGWLSNLGLALGVSVVGVALAGTGALSTSAAPRTPPPTTALPVTRTVPVASPSPTIDPEVLSAFPGADEVEPAALREAIVAERAAQRAEELAKSADAVSRTARTEGSKARQQQLDADQLATQSKGAELTKAALDRAVAARIAAAATRAAAEAAQQSAVASPTTDPVPAPVDTGGAAVSPVPGAVVGAGFGDVGLWARYHTGLDFRAAYGTPIRAVKAGVVLYADNSGNWAGNHVAVQHADGMTTMYSHMSSMAVSAGATVTAGQVIGYVGQTGRAFGPHLHFELYPAGVKYGDIYHAVDPVPWLRAAGVITH